MTKLRKSSAGRVRLIFELLGPAVVMRLLAGVLVGALLFVVELGFSYLLQAFLVVLRVMELKRVSVPHFHFLPEDKGLTYIILGVGLAKGALIWAQYYLSGSAMEDFRFRQRSKVLAWALQNEASGSSEVNTIFNEQVVGAANAIQAGQQVLTQLTASVLIMAVLLYLAPWMTLPLIAALAVLFVPARLIHRAIRMIGKQVAQEWSGTNARLQMSIKNLILIHIYGTQKTEFDSAQQRLRAYHSNLLRFYRLGGLNGAITQVIGIGVICAIAGPLGQFQRGISSGLKLSCFYLFFRFIQSSNLLSSQLTAISLNWHWFSELFRWWEKSERQGSGSAVLASPAVRVKTISSPIQWDFENVSFTYPGGQHPVIHEMSIRIAPGEITAIVGPSGVGKSTLLGLLLGTITPTSGDVEVVLDGERRSLASCRADILPVIGYVGPESFMVKETVYNNLIYGLPRTPTAKEVQFALEQAQCDFISELPKGLDHELAEQGQGLSAGQKQRLSLARALLRNPKALILDEATSNLDTETEKRLLDIFEQLRGQMTIISATHRKAMSDIADQRLILGKYVGVTQS